MVYSLIVRSISIKQCEHLSVRFIQINLLQVDSVMVEKHFFKVQENLEAPDLNLRLVLIIDLQKNELNVNCTLSVWFTEVRFMTKI